MRRALVVLTLCLPVLGCSDDGVQSEAVVATTSSGRSTSDASTPTSSTPTSSAAGGEIPDCPSRPEGSSPSNFDAAAGTYAANLTAVDAAAPSVTFDVVQWLVGDDAVAAYEAETGDPGGPPNDYFIRNQNDEVRTAPLRADATVFLVRLASDGTADVSPGTVDELPGYLDLGFEGDVYWLTFEGGEVVEVCEQYRP